MTYPIILLASSFLLISFVVDYLGRRFRFPSVIALIAIGFIGNPLMAYLGYTLKGLDLLVPILGTIGLILIVLEGAADIDLKRERLPLISGASMSALGGILCFMAVFAPLGVWSLGLTPFQAITLTVPFAVISSAVAIPSSSFMPTQDREFVVYESSISDVIGVLLFFSLLRSDGSLSGILTGLIGGGILSLLIAIVCALGLVLLLMRISGHIRFIPLLAGLFGLYAIGELMHLSSLIMVLLFGLALNNPQLVTRIRPLSHWVDESYDKTLNEFKVILVEITFAIRGFFFILLGYSTKLTDVLSWQAWFAAILILSVIYSSRYFLLRLGHHTQIEALTWLAPRGLITILLYLALKETIALPAFLDGTVVIVVLASSLLILQAHRKVAIDEEIPDAAGAPGKAQPQIAI
ncbi:MAG: cation:proton antiporter [Rugosibacter sp.]|nr:cation:proton antiporter [Rugosibacter sp.]